MIVFGPSMHRRRRRRRLLVAAVTFGILGAGAASYLIVVLPLIRSPHTPCLGTISRSATGSPTPRPGCPSAELPDAARLGAVAWVADGKLTVLHLGSCRQAVLVASGAEPPVRFSPDGRWLAFA